MNQVRSEPVVFSDEDVTTGVGAIGAPIIGTHGETVAAVSVSAVVGLLYGDRKAAVVQAVRECAAAISADLT